MNKATCTLRFPLVLTPFEGGVLLKMFLRSDPHTLSFMGIAKQMYDWLEDVGINGEPGETITIHVSAQEAGLLTAVLGRCLRLKERDFFINVIDQLQHLEMKLRSCHIKARF